MMLTSFLFREILHGPRVVRVEQSLHRTRHAVYSQMKPTTDCAYQGQGSAPLTEKNVDKHNHQSRLCSNSDDNSKPHRQQVDRRKEAAKSLGIDTSNQAYAGMWEGFDRLNPMERFVVETTSRLEVWKVENSQTG